VGEVIAIFQQFKMATFHHFGSAMTSFETTCIK